MIHRFSPHCIHGRDQNIVNSSQCDLDLNFRYVSDLPWMISLQFVQTVDFPVHKLADREVDLSMYEAFLYFNCLSGLDSCSPLQLGHMLLFSFFEKLYHSV